MSKPVLSNLFTFSGRRNRLSYFLVGLAQFAVLIASSIIAFVGMVCVDDGFDILGFALILSVAPAILVTIVSSWATGSQRVRDFGHSGVWILVCVLPYIGWLFALALYFIPSSKGANKYGASCIE